MALHAFHVASWLTWPLPDPYYAEIVGPDETSFWDFERSSMTVGWEETYIDAADNGKVADSVVGKRGKDARLDS